MELSEAMRTQNACRYYRDEPVPDEVLYNAVELSSPSFRVRSPESACFRARVRLGE